MKLYKSMAKNLDIAIEILFFHLNMNGFAFHVDIVIKRKHELSKIQRKKK